jgi:hypothetical protein
MASCTVGESAVREHDGVGNPGRHQRGPRRPTERAVCPSAQCLHLYLRSLGRPSGVDSTPYCPSCCCTLGCTLGLWLPPESRGASAASASPHSSNESCQTEGEGGNDRQTADPNYHGIVCALQQPLGQLDTAVESREKSIPVSWSVVAAHSVPMSAHLRSMQGPESRRRVAVRAQPVC